jgi:hypothetical protein
MTGVLSAADPACATAVAGNIAIRPKTGPMAHNSAGLFLKVRIIASSYMNECSK